MVFRRQQQPVLRLGKSCGRGKSEVGEDPAEPRRRACVHHEQGTGSGAGDGRRQEQQHLQQQLHRGTLMTFGCGEDSDAGDLCPRRGC